MKTQIKRTYHPSGTPQYEAPYKNNKIHGLTKWWHSNGQFECVASYKNFSECGARIDFEY